MLLCCSEWLATCVLYIFPEWSFTMNVCKKSFKDSTHYKLKPMDHCKEKKGSVECWSILRLSYPQYFSSVLQIFLFSLLFFDCFQAFHVAVFPEFYSFKLPSSSLSIFFSISDKLFSRHSAMYSLIKYLQTFLFILVFSSFTSGWSKFLRHKVFWLVTLFVHWWAS